MITGNSITGYTSRKCYFKVTYYDYDNDYDLRYPKVEAVVYLGNASELKDSLPTKEAYLNFQNAESYVNHGFLNSQGHKLDEDEMIIMQFSEANVKKSIFDFDEMVQELIRWNTTSSD